MSRRRIVTVIAVGLGGVAWALPAIASPPLVKAAKDAGFPAQNCQYCHVSKLPKKETFKSDDLNERGKWLAAEKAKQQASAVKVEWLQSYPGGKN